MSLRPSSQKVGHVTALVCMASRQRFVLVESGTELDLLRPHVRGRAQIEDMNGRPNVQEAWRILDSRGKRNFVAMVDADFDEVVGRNRAASRLVYVSVADNRSDSTIDLEAALIQTRALQDLCETVIGEPLVRLGGPLRFTHQLREATRQAAAAVGAFRAAVMDVFEDSGSIQPIGELTGDEWAKVVSVQTGAIDRQALEDVVKSRVRNVLTYPDVRQRASDFERNDGAGWLLCRGHDMTEILALRFSWLTSRHMTRRDVEKLLCNSYRGNPLNETAFGAKLEQFCGVG
jgi:hypothetical protein